MLQFAAIRVRAGFAAFFIVCAAFAVFYSIRTHHPPEHATTDTVIYSSEAYAYAFMYPSAYRANEYTSEFVTVSDPKKASDAELVYVMVDNSGAAAESFQAFAHADAARYCAASSPNSSVRCTGVTRWNPYTTPKGLQGEVFYLELETSTGTALTTREAGPFWAFNISANARGAYTVLLIYPRHFADETENATVETPLGRDIVDSLIIDKK